MDSRLSLDSRWRPSPTAPVAVASDVAGAPVVLPTNEDQGTGGKEEEGEGGRETRATEETGRESELAGDTVAEEEELDQIRGRRGHIPSRCPRLHGQASRVDQETGIASGDADSSHLLTPS